MNENGNEVPEVLTMMIDTIKSMRTLPSSGSILKVRKLLRVNRKNFPSFGYPLDSFKSQPYSHKPWFHSSMKISPITTSPTGHYVLCNEKV